MLQVNKLNIEKEELLKNKINSSININSKFKSEYKAYLGILKINNMWLEKSILIRIWEVMKN